MNNLVSNTLYKDNNTDHIHSHHAHTLVTFHASVQALVMKSPRGWPLIICRNLGWNIEILVRNLLILTVYFTASMIKKSRRFQNLIVNPFALVELGTCKWGYTFSFLFNIKSSLDTRPVYHCCRLAIMQWKKYYNNYISTGNLPASSACFSQV